MGVAVPSVEAWPRPRLCHAPRLVQQPPLEAGRAPAPLPQLSAPLGGGRVLAAHPAPVLQTAWPGAVLLFCSAAVLQWCVALPCCRSCTVQALRQMLCMG